MLERSNGDEFNNKAGAARLSNQLSEYFERCGFTEEDILQSRNEELAHALSDPELIDKGGNFALNFNADGTMVTPMYRTNAKRRSSILQALFGPSRRGMELSPGDKEILRQTKNKKGR